MRGQRAATDLNRPTRSQLASIIKPGHQEVIDIIIDAHDEIVQLRGMTEEKLNTCLKEEQRGHNNILQPFLFPAIELMILQVKPVRSTLYMKVSLSSFLMKAAIYTGR